MNFVAIDFETANRQRASACSVGLVRVVNGRLEDNASWLIKPPQGTYFLQDFIAIHGITPDIVAYQPDFLELWPKMQAFIGEDLLVAHNASFDMNVLRGLFEKYDLPLPNFKYLCSLATARKAWSFPSNKLDYLANTLGLSLKHHQADSDANVCAQIMLKAMEQHGCGSLTDLINKLGLKVCNLVVEPVSPGYRSKTSWAASLQRKVREETAAVKDDRFKPVSLLPEDTM